MKASKTKEETIREIEEIKLKLSSGAYFSDHERRSLKEKMASGLRAFPTEAEAKLKLAISEFSFKQNEIVFGFIPDFSSRKFKTIIEVDGSIHELKEIKDRDNHKDSVFLSHGWKVLRFTNRQVFEEITYVVGEIRKSIKFPHRRNKKKRKNHDYRQKRKREKFIDPEIESIRVVNGKVYANGRVPPEPKNRRSMLSKLGTKSKEQSQREEQMRRDKQRPLTKYDLVRYGGQSRWR